MTPHKCRQSICPINAAIYDWLCSLGQCASATDTHKCDTWAQKFADSHTPPFHVERGINCSNALLGVSEFSFTLITNVLGPPLACALHSFLLLANCIFFYCQNTLVGGDAVRQLGTTVHQFMENTLSWVREQKTKQEPCTAKLELLVANTVLTGLLPFSIRGLKVAETNATAQPPFSSHEQKPRKNTAEINHCCALALPPHIHTAPHRPTTRDRGTNGVLVLVRSLLLAQV